MIRTPKIAKNKKNTKSIIPQDKISSISQKNISEKKKKFQTNILNDFSEKRNFNNLLNEVQQE